MGWFLHIIPETVLPEVESGAVTGPDQGAGSEVSGGEIPWLWTGLQAVPAGKIRKRNSARLFTE